eukprot:1882112-Pleurochrysis_carterae.AAC.2
MAAPTTLQLQEGARQGDFGHREKGGDKGRVAGRIVCEGSSVVCEGSSVRGEGDRREKKRQEASARLCAAAEAASLGASRRLLREGRRRDGFVVGWVGR